MYKGSTVRLNQDEEDHLAARGGLSLRGAHTFSRSAVLVRQLQLLEAILERHDPRRSGALPSAMADLVAGLLPKPWTIDPAAVEHLALRVQEAPDFASRVTAAGVEPAALVGAVGALAYCEKAALLDLALRAQAPAAAAVEAARTPGGGAAAGRESDPDQSNSAKSSGHRRPKAG